MIAPFSFLISIQDGQIHFRKEGKTLFKIGN